MAPEKDNLLTPEAAAERLAIAPRTIREWLRQGKIKGVKVGKLWRIKEDALEEFLTSGFTTGNKEED